MEMEIWAQFVKNLHWNLIFYLQIDSKFVRINPKHCDSIVDVL